MCCHRSKNFVRRSDLQREKGPSRNVYHAIKRHRDLLDSGDYWTDDDLRQFLEDFSRFKNEHGEPHNWLLALKRQLEQRLGVKRVNGVRNAVEARYYELLGIKEGDDEETIKQSYRRLARLYHPDTHPDNPEAASKMQELNMAYDAIMRTFKQ